jgi:hypothetical protein
LVILPFKFDFEKSASCGLICLSERAMDNSKEILQKEWFEKSGRYIWLASSAASGASFCVLFFVDREKTFADYFFNSLFIFLAVYLLARLVLNALLELKFINSRNAFDDWYGFIINLAAVVFIGTILAIYFLKI